MARPRDVTPCSEVDLQDAMLLHDRLIRGEVLHKEVCEASVIQRLSVLLEEKKKGHAKSAHTGSLDPIYDHD